MHANSRSGVHFDDAATGDWLRDVVNHEIDAAHIEANHPRGALARTPDGGVDAIGDVARLASR